MRTDQLKHDIEQDITQALGDLAKHFHVEWGEILVEDPDDERLSIEGDIVFSWQRDENSERIESRHAFVGGWTEFDGCGIELGEDSEIYAITCEFLFKQMYFDKVFFNYEGEVFL